MYIQKVFEEDRVDVMHQLIEQHALGALTVFGQKGLSVDHVPFYLDRSGSSEFVVLRTHIAKNNPLHQHVESGDEVLVVFTGADSYISPSWLPNRYITKRVQPSWAYTAVHAYGQINIIHDEAWKLMHLTESVIFFEQMMSDPWDMAEAPDEFIKGLQKHIVGIEFEITKLEGKSQLMHREVQKIVVI